MKNIAVQEMMAIQHNVNPKDVRVEFTHAVGSEYNFEVTIWTEDLYQKYEVTVQSKPL
jgi:hypothetical protein